MPLGLNGKNETLEIGSYVNLFSEMISPWLSSTTETEKERIVVSLLVVARCCMDAFPESHQRELKKTSDAIYQALGCSKPGCP